LWGNRERLKSRTHARSHRERREIDSKGVQGVATGSSVGTTLMGR